MSPFQIFLAPTSSDQSTAGIAFRHRFGGGAGILARGPRVCTVPGQPDTSRSGESVYRQKPWTLALEGSGCSQKGDIEKGSWCGGGGLVYGSNPLEDIKANLNAVEQGVQSKGDGLSIAEDCL